MAALNLTRVLPLPVNIALLALVLIFAGCGGGGGAGAPEETASEAPPVVTPPIATWPPAIPSTAPALVKTRQEQWKANPKDWHAHMPAHDATGAYLNYKTLNVCQTSATAMIDADGVFMLKDRADGVWYYDPVKIATCGLLAWSQWLNTSDQQHLDSALAHGRKLAQMQGADGALRYQIRWLYYVTDTYLPVGFTSAMAQGQALSLYARLYHHTNDQAFADAGAKALAYLLTPVDSGGVMTTLADLRPSLSGFVWFEEFVTQPTDNYILNGYMFALVGLYDWSQVHGVAVNQQRAGENFDKGIQSLEQVLPLYDMGGLSTYDLTYATMNNSAKLSISLEYHVIHIHQLDALYAITGRPLFRQTRDLWGKYLDDVARVGP